MKCAFLRVPPFKSVDPSTAMAQIIFSTSANRSPSEASWSSSWVSEGSFGAVTMALFKRTRGTWKWRNTHIIEKKKIRNKHKDIYIIYIYIYYISITNHNIWQPLSLHGILPRKKYDSAAAIEKNSEARPRVAGWRLRLRIRCCNQRGLQPPGDEVFMHETTGFLPINMGYTHSKSRCHWEQWGYSGRF